MKACLFQAANRSPFFTVLSGVSPNLLQGVYLNIPGIQSQGKEGKLRCTLLSRLGRTFPRTKRRDGTRIFLYPHYKSYQN